jgi:hypothetical protein
VPPLQAENASLSSRLHEVSEQLADREAELRTRLTSNELQLKEQIVYNVSLKLSLRALTELCSAWQCACQSVRRVSSLIRANHASALPRRSRTACRRSIN